MKLYFLFVLSVVFLVGCMGTLPHYDPETGMNQIHTYDNSWLNTSSKLSLYQQCDKDKEKPENCKTLGLYHSDTTGLVPSVGGQALQGGFIGLGLSSSDDDVNVIGGSTIVDQSCRGNCGGGPK